MALGKPQASMSPSSQDGQKFEASNSSGVPLQGVYMEEPTLMEDGKIGNLVIDIIRSLKVTQANFAIQTVTVGEVTYVGTAPVGTATDEALWQVQKIDSTTGTVVTWADGNDAFDNVWDNYATLTYA